jgi:hypothetical protein
LVADGWWKEGILEVVRGGVKAAAPTAARVSAAAVLLGRGIIVYCSFWLRLFALLVYVTTLICRLSVLLPQANAG